MYQTVGNCYSPDTLEMETRELTTFTLDSSREDD